MGYDVIISKVEQSRDIDQAAKAAIIEHLKVLRIEESNSRLTSSAAKHARDTLRVQFGFRVERFRRF